MYVFVWQAVAWLLVLSLAYPVFADPQVTALGSSTPALNYELKLEVISDGYDGQTCWFHPRAGTIPGNTPTVVLTMQKWSLKSSDLFLPIQSLESKDFGKSWTHPIEHVDTLGRRPEPGGVVVGVCDFTPMWHRQTGKLLGTGHTVRYKDDKLISVRPRETAWSVYDPANKTWSPWAELDMPDLPPFWNSGAGSTQRVDLANGEILLPIYCKGEKDARYATTILKCSFDGQTLRYVEHGNLLNVPVGRGLYEPSLTKFADRYYLTMRNDEAAYVAVSDDGLHFADPRKWTFDDGADLGSYNTQAHWVTHSDGMFLSYTRRGANNDHVIRHRAPLLMARVDPIRLQVIRSAERELVPNKGAQLGNFAVVDVSPNETWITTSEGMKPDPGNHGANGRVYAARILWSKPNSLVPK